MNYRIFIICLFAFGCNTRNIDRKYANANATRKTSIKKYSNGNVKLEVQYINRNDSTILDGFAKHYYENGKLESIVHFDNNLLNGFDSVYDLHGNLIEKKYCYYGSLFGLQYKYASNGTIENIVSYFLNARQFLIQYNSDGTIDLFRGSVVMATTLDDTLYKVNKKIHINDFVAVAPATKTSLHIILTKDKKILVDTTFYKFKIINNYYMNVFSYKFGHSGEYVFSAIGCLTDSNKDVILKIDTCLVRLNVR